MSVLCWFGLHPWAKWGEVVQVARRVSGITLSTEVDDEGLYTTNSEPSQWTDYDYRQERCCNGCGIVERRKVKDPAW